MGKLIDLNADVGEGGPDSDLFPLISSASIACGGHAGDEDSMRAAVQAALRLGVRIGAHPSYPDMDGFGRRSMPMSADSLVASIRSQTAALVEIARSLGGRVRYIKPHGALYNEAAGDADICAGLLEVASQLNLPMMMLQASPCAGMSPDIISEGFIDRRYGADGMLIPRTSPEALIDSPKDAAEQALRLAPLVDSLCVHSDTLGAAEMLARARGELLAAGFSLGYEE